MKLLRQLLIILGIGFLGETINKLLNIPIPGNVIGMVILFICLFIGVVKLEMISDISKFLLDHLAFFFVPVGVGLIGVLGMLKANLAAFLVVSMITTVIVMVITGHVVQFIKRRFER